MLKTIVEFKRSKRFKAGLYNYNVYFTQDKCKNIFCGSISRFEWNKGPVLGEIFLCNSPDKLFYAKTFREMKKLVTKYIKERLYGIHTITY